jgi:hypothetical protein
MRRAPLLSARGKCDRQFLFALSYTYRACIPLLRELIVPSIETTNYVPAFKNEEHAAQRLLKYRLQGFEKVPEGAAKRELA